MIQLYGALRLMLLLLLFTGCAKKEMYRFAAPVGSFEDVRKEKKTKFSTALAPNTTTAEPEFDAATTFSASVEPEFKTTVEKPLTEQNAVHKPDKKPLLAAPVPAKLSGKFIKAMVKEKKRLGEDPEGKRKVHELALLGFILGLAGVLLHVVGLTLTGVGGGYLVLAFLSTIGAIVFSWLGYRRIKKNPEKYSGRGFSLAGFVIGLLQLLFYTFILILFIAWSSGN